jgi:methylated-DNA-[protein]-cysteine S-methyltransferase
MVYAYVQSPVGKLLLAGDEAGLKWIRFPGEEPGREPEPGWKASSDLLKDAIEQIRAYFAGERQTFSLKLAPQVTPFQGKVLQALIEIPYGETRSYGELAGQIGNPRASRAVGGACARNPIPIVIPCHRVIGAKGSLTGFGGGLNVKEALLSLEQRYL